MENFPKPVTKRCTKTIFKQMNNSFYFINEKGSNLSNCFFTYIKNHKKIIPVVIINGCGEYNDKINISIDNINKTIELTDKKYINNQYNITIIEIKGNNHDGIQFLEIDEDIYNEDLERYFYNESIYIIQYDNKNENLVSYGVINSINHNKIKYSSNIKSNSRGSPIFSLSNNKIIGIHEYNSNSYNTGIFLKEMIIKFIREYNINYRNNSNNNEINIKISINKEEIYRKIYFLDNYENDEHIHDNLKELNELNTKLYINNKNYKYQKYIIPEDEGIYDIKLKFNINLTDCSYMFFNCKNIININFTSFNTKNIRNMRNMFSKCNFRNINLLSFDTTNVINMREMFSYCVNLNKLDLSSFVINKDTNTFAMFYGCSSLKQIPDIRMLNIENEIKSSSIKSLSKENNIKKKELDVKRNQENLIGFILSRVVMNDDFIKNKENLILNDFPVISFEAKEIKVNCILISNDIMLVPTKYIKNEKPNEDIYLWFPQIHRNILSSIYDLIIENDNFQNIFSVIKVLDKKFLFEKYFKIPDDSLNISTYETFIINNKREEESIDITKNKISQNYLPNTPIYIKKDN